MLNKECFTHTPSAIHSYKLCTSTVAILLKESLLTLSTNNRFHFSSFCHHKDKK